MRVELIELLRCPAAHEPSALITVAHARVGDQLVEGTLGCPVCGASYALRDGVVYFTADVESCVSEPVDALRLAALLGLDTPSARVGLCGAYAAAAGALGEANAAECVVVNGMDAPDDVAGALRVDASLGIPLANSALHGFAVDAANIALLADAARVVRPGGRVVAPVSAPLPAGVTELARDDHEWVAAVDAAASPAESAPVPLLRRHD